MEAVSQRESWRPILEPARAVGKRKQVRKLVANRARTVFSPRILGQHHLIASFAPPPPDEGLRFREQKGVAHTLLDPFRDAGLKPRPRSYRPSQQPLIWMVSGIFVPKWEFI
jgi:hypothetical protein